MDSKKKDIITILVWIILFFLLFVPFGCSGNWIVGNWEINPSDSSSSLITLYDQDSTTHKFKRPIVLNNDNWCYYHNMWEVVSRSE